MLVNLRCGGKHKRNKRVRNKQQIHRLGTQREKEKKEKERDWERESEKD